MKLVHAMYGLLALVILGASYMVWSREQIRPGQEIVTAAEKRKAGAEQALQRARAQPLLPYLDPTWTKVRFMIEGCGLEFRPIRPDEIADAQVFAGPAVAWHATVFGPTLGVLACTWLAAQEYPIWLDALSVTPTDSQLVVSVLGRLEEAQ